MNNLMIDIETLGTSHDALVFSIGAVFWCPKTGELGQEFYQVIDFVDAAKYLKLDAATVKWWMQQGDAAKTVFNTKNQGALEDVLIEFKAWIEDNTTSSVKVWGKGPSFDCVILRNAFKAVDVDLPWKYWNERDVRTVFDLRKTLPDFEVENPVKHNAIEDARYQAKICGRVLSQLSQLGNHIRMGYNNKVGLI